MQRSTLSAVTSVFHSAREYLSPLLQESKFREHGVLTPEEFVAAGDYLCYKCPTWAWSAGDAKLKKDYLPDEKQYLVTRNVPCISRVKDLEYNESEETDQDDFLITHPNHENQSVADIDDAEKTKPAPVNDIPDIDDIPDLDEDMEGFGTVEHDDPAALEKDSEDKILRTRFVV